MEPTVFYDAIHTFMDFQPMVIDVINTVQFQRLRNIKQLGFSYFVYPSASHNRFEHALGTCFLAGKLASHLLEKIQRDTTDNERLILCVQLAGLCHDLGHCPFSHLVQEFITQEIDVNWKHEVQSCKMFDHLLNENKHIKDKLEEKEIEFIKSLITGDSTDRDEPKFLFQIVNNTTNGVDVDKWDYLLRDSHILGFGLNFQHDRLITFSQVIDDDICFRDKNVEDVYAMFYARFRLHKLVYQHKTVLLFNELFKKALKLVAHKLRIREKIENMEEFTYFTDNIMEDILSSEDTDFQRSQDYLKDIINRSYTRANKSKYDADPTNIICCEASYDYGHGEKNPLRNVKFYEKGKAKKIRYDDLPDVRKVIPPKSYIKKNTFYFQRRKNRTKTVD